MITVNDVLNFIESIAPGYMKEDWDKVGLNCGHGDKEVKKILVALDPFAPVCQEAKQWGADLLVTHHALIWEPGFITDETEQGRNALYLIENGIAHINAHTNLDCAPGGVNDRLAEVLGLSNVTVLNPVGTDPQGNPYGLIRIGTVKEQPVAAFLANVKEKLGCEGLRYVDPAPTVCKVAVGGGSCSGALSEVVAAGCDTFVTADVRYNGFHDAFTAGINLIDAGHFHTENPIVSVIAKKIAAAFPEATVKISENHTDVMKFG
jgi:dinuclear metal center YbgI/SA1388 family protein